MRRLLTTAWLCCATALVAPELLAQDAGAGPGSAEAGAADAAAADPDADWCPEGVNTLPGPVCAFVPDNLAERSPRTLIIFLHGVVQPGTGWQKAPIRGMAAAAKRFGFALLAPRGRRGVARSEMHDWWAWPTGSSAQQQHEASVIEEWNAARRALEAAAGRPFDKVLVFGFSSGAYYASSLAMRGRLPVDGYAVFAGGAAPYTNAMMRQVRVRPPIFVGYGLKDKAATKDARKLLKALRSLKWRHHENAAPKAGHTITDAQLKEAVTYLRK